MGLLERFKKDERGISAVIVVVSLIGIFGATLLSIDAGNMWQTRRTIIRGTDATALDQAIFAAKTGATDCAEAAVTSGGVTYQAWTQIMQVNTAGFDFVDGMDADCEFFAHPTIPGAGYVGVQSRKVADTRFGSLFGIGDTKPFSFSAAQIGYPISIEGLRPIGLCILNDHVQEWISRQNGSLSEAAYNALRGNPTTEHPVYDGAGVVHHITWNKDQPDECGSADSSPGNWGWLDYDGGSNPVGDLRDWIINGYDGLVTAPDDCDADGTGPDPSGGAGDQCNGDPGAQSGTGNTCSDSSVGNALACIKSTAGNIKEFPIVIFDSAISCEPGGGGGNNCKYDLARYAFVRLWGFDVGGNESSRYFDFEFVEGVATGTCCDTSPSQDDVKVVFLCSVDHDTSGMTVAQRCGN